MISESCYYRETVGLAKTIISTFVTITESDQDQLKRIANAYAEAQQLMTNLKTRTGRVGPGIETCVMRSWEYQDLDDVAAAGWMLAATKERLDQQDLFGWEELARVIDLATDILAIASGRLQ